MALLAAPPAAAAGASYQLTFDSTITLTLSNEAAWNGSGTMTYHLKASVPLQGGPTEFQGNVPESYPTAQGAFDSQSSCQYHEFEITTDSGIADSMGATLTTDSTGNPTSLQVNPGLPSENVTEYGNCGSPGSPQSTQVAGWLGGWFQFHPSAGAGAAPGSGSGCSYELLPGLRPGSGDVVLQGTFTNQATANETEESPCLGPYSGDPYPEYVFDDGTITVSETTQVTLVKTCPGTVGKVTLSEGDAPPLGSVVCEGETIKTGPGSRVEVTFPDGSVVRAGPNSQFTLYETSFTEQGTVRQHVENVLGQILIRVGDSSLGEGLDWVGCAATGLTCSPSMFGGTGPENERAVVGVRGSSMTVSSVPGTDELIFHVVSGTGYVRVTGKPEVDFSAGHGILLDGRTGSWKFTDRWPSGARALVPSAYAPPSVNGLTVRQVGLGLRIGFKLDRRANILIRLLRGTHVVSKTRFAGRKGKNTRELTLRATPRPGIYCLEVTATHGEYGGLADRKVRVMRGGAIRVLRGVCYP